MKIVKIVDSSFFENESDILWNIAQHVNLFYIEGVNRILSEFQELAIVHNIDKYLVPKEFIEKWNFVDEDYWEDICKYQILSEDFIEKNKNFIDWNLISKFQTLSESFIEKYKHSLKWDYIVQMQTLSEPFIEKMYNFEKSSENTEGETFIYWELISYFQDLSLPFIKQYENLLDENILEIRDVKRINY